jgi:hypothetical protein
MYLKSSPASSLSSTAMCFVLHAALLLLPQAPAAVPLTTLGHQGLCSISNTGNSTHKESLTLSLDLASNGPDTEQHCYRLSGTLAGKHCDSGSQAWQEQHRPSRGRACHTACSTMRAQW